MSVGDEEESVAIEAVVTEPTGLDETLFEPAIRPIRGHQLGSIYVEKPNPKRRAKGGRKWTPPKVAMEAPEFCLERGFSTSTCFECQLPECWFALQPERINKKRKKP